MVECAKWILGLYHEAQGNNADNFILEGRTFQVSLASCKFQ